MHICIVGELQWQGIPHREILQLLEANQIRKEISLSLLQLFKLFAEGILPLHVCSKFVSFRWNGLWSPPDLKCCLFSRIARGLDMNSEFLVYKRPSQSVQLVIKITKLFLISLNKQISDFQFSFCLLCFFKGVQPLSLPKEKNIMPTAFS